MSRMCRRGQARSEEQEPHSGLLKHVKIAEGGMFIAPPPSHGVVALRWAHAISELTDPFWAAWCEGGSISELKGVFSLFASEMSSETAPLKALRWISELKSQELFLR